MQDLDYTYWLPQSTNISCQIKKNYYTKHKRVSKITYNKMKLFALLLLKFVCLSVGTNPEVEEAFDPDSGETSFQRRYVISVANKQEDCYYISDVKTNQVINFHFVVSTYYYSKYTKA